MALIYGRDGKVHIYGGSRRGGKTRTGAFTTRPKGEEMEFEDSRPTNDAWEKLRESLLRDLLRMFAQGTFSRLPSGDSFAVRAALQYFGFTELPSEETLRTTFRGIAIATHPDTAGSEYYTEEFQRAKEHYDVLLNHIKGRGGK